MEWVLALKIYIITILTNCFEQKYHDFNIIWNCERCQ